MLFHADIAGDIAFMALLIVLLPIQIVRFQIAINIVIILT